MTIRRPTRRDVGRGLRGGPRVGLWSGLVGGLVCGLVLGVLVEWGLLGLLMGLWFGLVGGLVGWLIDVWRVPLAATLDATPRSVYQRDMRSQLLGGLMGWLACVLGFSLLFGLASLRTEREEFWLGFGLLFGLVSGPMVGLLFLLRGGAAPSLVLTEIALRPKSRRVRFMPLLETSLMRQVLRQAGAVYQFRHADLQDRLADCYQIRLMRHREA